MKWWLAAFSALSAWWTTPHSPSPTPTIMARVCGESFPLEPGTKLLHHIGAAAIHGRITPWIEVPMRVYFQIKMLPDQNTTVVRVRAYSPVPLLRPVMAKLILPKGWHTAHATHFEVMVNAPFDYALPIAHSGPGQPEVQLSNRAGATCHQ
jgi:hypothetical protein